MSDVAKVGLMFFGISSIVAMVFFAIAWVRGQMTRGWVATTGVVVDRRTGLASGGMPAIYPTFQWRTPKGRPISGRRR